MRIAVIGTSGAGKTTLARRIAGRLKLPHVELDAINWQAGWRDLNSVQFGTYSFPGWPRALRLYMGDFPNTRFPQDRCYVLM